MPTETVETSTSPWVAIKRAAAPREAALLDKVAAVRLGKVFVNKFMIAKYSSSTRNFYQNSLSPPSPLLSNIAVLENNSLFYCVLLAHASRFRESCKKIKLQMR
jgi:hypothetical protein